MGSGEIKKILFLAVAIVVIANLLLGNSILAKKLEITDKDVGNIKDGLDLVKLLLSLSINDAKLKTVLNIMIEGGETGTDITYGLLVLSAFNEMEFIDMVVSQRYKTETTKYFESILDQRINLAGYYKGIGYDLPRILSGKITGPMAALTLNSFEMADKTVQILTALNILRNMKTYDGLRRYFEMRRDDNEFHEIAWDEAKTIMGKEIKSIGGFYREDKRNKELIQLESQFSSLYEKWGPYTDEKGIKKEFKQQAKEELKNTLVSAIQAQKLVEEKPTLSLLDKIKLAFENLVKEAGKIGSVLEEEIAKINTKIKELVSLGGAQVSQAPNNESEAQKGEIKEKWAVDELTEVQPQSSFQSKQGAEQDLSSGNHLEEIEEIVEEIAVIETLTEAEPLSISQRLCEKILGAQPLRLGVIFNKIAWMGSQNSANDEWVELKNISGGEVDLTGWQILDKDQQIKVVFSGGRTSASGLLLLERTDDNSLPGAAADLIYTGALNDTNEVLYLFDNNCQLQDEVLASPDWPAGSKENRKPMERSADLSWQTQGEAAVIFNYGTPAPAPSFPPPEQTTIKILISEVQISPIKERFVELYNPNSQPINLSGWYIQRKTRTGTSWQSFISSTYFEGKTIGAISHFLVASSSQADILLSLTLTEGNSLILKNPNQEIIDKVGWGEAQEFETAPTENPLTGKSVGRKWSTSTQNYVDTDNNQNDFELQAPTPKAQNQSPGQSSNQAPGAFFVYTPVNPVAVGREVIFNAASSSDSDGTITAFIWDFGDNSSVTTSQATTSHSFLAVGNFLVSLIVSDNNNATSSATTTTITVANIETASLSVVINEIAWAGTKAGSSDEWLEFYNNSTSTINLTGWTLRAADGVPSITFSTSTGTTTIPAGGYFFLERTNSSTTNVAEDYIFSGALNNEGEKLELRDANNNLIDLVDFSSGWPAGTSSPNYISMERISATTTGTSSANWASNNLITRNGLDALGNKINGTPRAQNSVSVSPTTISSLADLFNEFSEITLTYFGSPYIIQNNLTVPASSTLKIEPKTTLKFNAGKGISVQGKLESSGGIFTANSENPSPDFWQKISFLNSEGSKLENIILKYGKIYLEGGNISISSSTLKNNKTAIEIYSGVSQIKNNVFQDNETSILLYSAASTTFSGNSAQNNNINGILTDASTIMTDTVWQSNTNFPFVIDYVKSIALGATLTIKEGTVVKIKPQTGTNWTGYVDFNGRLIAEGTVASPVVITSFKDDEYGGDTNNDGMSTLPIAGSWRFMRFNSTNSTSTLDRAIIRYGGGNCDAGFCWGAILQSPGVGIEIKNSVIEKNIWGIFSNESPCSAVFEKIKIENSIFRENDRNIYLGSGNECTP